MAFTATPVAAANGTTQPVPQPAEISYDPKRGARVIQPFKAVGKTSLDTLASLYRALNLNYTQERAAISTIRLESPDTSTIDGGPEVVTDTWQIVGNEIQKDIRELPSYLSAINGVENDRQFVNAVSKNPEMDNASIAALFNTSVTTPSNGTVLAVMALIRRGSTHFALAQYTLRHTTNASETYGSNVSDSNVEHVYTTAQLLSEVQDASLWAKPLPGRLVSKINAIPSPSAVTGYLWGWRKKPSTETTASDGRIEISTEYELEFWSTTIYPTV